MFKNVIAPIQAWLLYQGRCVGCGRDLNLGKKAKYKQGLNKIICECGRVFLLDIKTKKYRRALLTEA